VVIPQPATSSARSHMTTISGADEPQRERRYNMRPAMSKRREKVTAGSSKREIAANDPRFARVVAAVAGKRGVTRESRQGFGSGALKVNGKIFAMMTPGAEFVVKIPKARVDELVDQGVGERFEPGPGRIMKEWLALDGHPERWTELAEEAYRFVKGRD